MAFRRWLKAMNLKNGQISVEVLINFLIYLTLTIVLLGLSILPLQYLIFNANLRKVALIYAQIGHFGGQPKSYALGFIDMEDGDLKDVEDVIRAYLKKSHPYNTYIGRLFDIDEFINGLEIKPKPVPLSKLFCPTEVEITARYPINLFNTFNLGFRIKDKFIGLYFKKTITIVING